MHCSRRHGISLRGRTHRPELFIVVIHKGVKLDDLEELLEGKLLHLADLFDKLIFSCCHCFVNYHFEDSFRLFTVVIILKKIDLSSHFAQQTKVIFVQIAQRILFQASI